jgi:hypothetical protein
MGGRYKTFEELTSKVATTADPAQDVTTGRAAGHVSFEELMGRGKSPTGSQRRRRDQGASAGHGPGQVPLPGLGENAPERAPGLRHLGEGRAQGEPTRLGLNFLHTYWQAWTTTGVVSATKYGGGSAPYTDAGELGATIARQVGLRDLMWALVAYDPTDRHTFATGQPVELDVGNQLTQLRAGSSMHNNAWLAEAMTAAHAAGVKVWLTFGVMGTSFDAVRGEPIAPTAAGEWEPTIVGRDGQTYTLNLQYVCWMDWDPGHAGQSQDGVAFPVPSGREEDTDAEWHLRSLDVSSPYKRAYIREIAKQCASLLASVDGLLLRSLGIRLADVVEGIDLFNEVEHANQYARTVFIPGSVISGVPSGISGVTPLRQIEIVEAFASSERWGRACFQAAYALRTTLATLSCGEDIQIRLPGICSYSTGVNDTWEDRLDSLEGLVTGFVDEAVRYLSDRRYGPAWSEPEILAFLPRVLQGIDYHWYHTRRPGNDEPIRHIGYLVCEVAEIEQWIVSAINAAWHATDPSTDVLSSFPVTVLETGMPATDGSDSPGHIAYVPMGFGREEFQAFEVFRRLGGALASGARMIGWHSWMANSTGAFAGHGLRDDTGDDTALPEDATQRRSWFAYRRFTSLLSGMVRGSMVLPEVADRRDLEAFLALVDVHPFVVFRYVGTFSAPPLAPTGGPVTGLRYAWLVLRDPSAQPRGVPHLFGTWRGPRWTGRAFIVELGCAVLGGATPPGHLPSQAAVYGPSTEVVLCSPVEFLPADESGPVLLLSTEEILWAVV